ncbi:MAG: putative teichuronic acid biosynthesis glycosyltransferase TuaG [Haliscomenobacter sp.]|nr:putative teichuronic acid biosynthesis glycosyltransferase TuaG [Haliscomenobacter sp.]
MIKKFFPEVSVILPVYNSEKFLRECIDSILYQEVSDWELIIIDDCSIDDSIAIVNGYLVTDHRIIVIQNKKRLGPGPSREKGIRKAKGKFIALIDSDDIWHPEKLKLQLMFMKNKNYKASYCSYYRMSENAERISSAVKIPLKIDYDGLLKNTCITTSTFIYKRSLTPRERFKNIMGNEDLLLELAILKKENFAYGLRKSLVFYRLRANSVSSNSFVSALGVWKVYRHFENLNIVKSLFCFCHYAFNALKKRIIHNTMFSTNTFLPTHSH